MLDHPQSPAVAPAKPHYRPDDCGRISDDRDDGCRRPDRGFPAGELDPRIPRAAGELPPLVVAVSLVTFYVSVGIKLSLLTVTTSHVLITQPFVIIHRLCAASRFRSAHPRKRARPGASAFTAFRTITLPIVRPTVVGAALMAAAISFDDFVITFFTIGSGNTLPTSGLGDDALVAHSGRQRDRHSAPRRDDRLHASGARMTRYRG